MDPDDMSHVWIGTAAGDLVRADAITGLRCAGGSAEAFCSDGRIIRLADSACPADFCLLLLHEIAQARTDTRWFVIIGAEQGTDGVQWIQCRIDDLIEHDKRPARPPALN